MQKALKEVERTIAVLSPRYLTSLYAMVEWAAAFTTDPTGKESGLIPLRIEPCELKGLHSPIIATDLFCLNKLAAKSRLQQKIKQKPNRIFLRLPKVRKSTNPASPAPYQRGVQSVATQRQLHGT